MKRSAKPRATRRTVVLANLRVERRSLKRLHPLDEGIELMYYGGIGMTRSADEYLVQFGFSQGHHRVMYVLARHEGLCVGDLIKMLGISKQAAQRPIKQLLDGGYIAASRDPVQHRVKILQLTKTGRELEHQASSRKRAVIKKALGENPDAQALWMQVMQIIADNA